MMDADPDTVVSVIKEMRAKGKGIIGMKILGPGRHARPSGRSPEFRALA